MNNGQGINEHRGEISIAGIKTFTSDHLGAVVNGNMVGAKKPLVHLGKCYQR